MASLTNQEIERLKQLLEEKQKEVKVLYDKLMEAGAWPLDDDALDVVAGGRGGSGLDPTYGYTDSTFR